MKWRISFNTVPPSWLPLTTDEGIKNKKENNNHEQANVFQRGCQEPKDRSGEDMEKKGARS